MQRDFLLLQKRIGWEKQSLLDTEMLPVTECRWWNGELSAAY